MVFAENCIENKLIFLSLKLLDTKSFRFLHEVTPRINKNALSRTDVNYFNVSYSSILYLAFDHRIDSEKIKKIKLGMSAKEVTSILGQPLDIKDKYLKDGKTYTYTQPIDYAMTYPMLWVHFDLENKVNCVFAKEYIFWGTDDEVIYAIDENHNYKHPDTTRIDSIFR